MKLESKIEEVMRFEDQLNDMIGTFFQHEVWDSKKDFDKDYVKWKKKLTLKDIAFMYFNYWTLEPKLKEFNKLIKLVNPSLLSDSDKVK